MQEGFTNLLGLMGANVAIFEQVPAGLDHYEPLVTTMQEQQENYEKAASMPDFRAFTWVFLIPGIALVLLSGIALVGTGREARRSSVFETGAPTSLPEEAGRDRSTASNQGNVPVG